VKEDPVTGGLITLPFEGAISDNYWEHDTDICQDETINRYVVDPARWMGGPDPFWSAGGDFTPFQRPNGSWYIIDPFYLTFAFSGQLTRYYPYRTDDNYIDTCGGSGSIFNTYTLDRADYTCAFDHARDLGGDASGTLFTRDETYKVGAGDYQLTVEYRSTVKLDCAASAANRPAGSSPFAGPVCGCQSRPAGQVIDASDPIVNTLEVSMATDSADVNIDEPGDTTIEVTCEGRRVKNAQVEVTLKPDAVLPVTVTKQVWLGCTKTM